MTPPTWNDAATRVVELLADGLGVEVASWDTDLIEAGMIDSLALVTLIVGLEDTFDCQLPLDGFDIDQFRSVRTIVGFLGSADVLAAT